VASVLLWSANALGRSRPSVAPGTDCLFFKRSGERPISRLFHGFEVKLSTALTTQKGDKACAKFRGFDVYLMPL
jgi:hypothetical protein